MEKKIYQDQNLDVKLLIETLNRAISEEWLAFYQYWIGAQIMVGPMRKTIEQELLKHAQEEYNHAQRILNRVLELGGIPVLAPSDWVNLSQCSYGTPNDPFVVNILKQNLLGENCAIKRYGDLAKITDNIDFATCDLATDILQEELEHANDIEDFLNDIEATLGYIKKKL